MMKNNLIERYNSLKKPLSKNEDKIYKYLIDFNTNVEEISIKNIFKKTNTGFSTLYSFLKKMNFSSMKELTFFLKEEELKSSKDFQDNVGNDNNNEITYLYFKILNENSKNIDDKLITDFVQLILKKKYIYFLGLGESELVCMEMSYRLIRFGIQSSVLKTEDGYIVSKTLSLDSEDLLICVSISGESKIIVEAAKIAKDKGLSVVSICSNPNSTLAKVTNFCIPFVSNNITSSDFYISSILPAIYLCDILSKKLFSINEEKYRNFREKTSKLITKYVKYKN
ncbi:MurR/RpiR family transcriptional regulator [Spiroplasma endosymbiont of Crioceris asparagi]|uniref:MurR/RpiR family transcriptional regulator n=1 Tax=Spiroplasma endosymbiont of Crioceris asparagi TaxID=3066286 RepID=UPI0030CBDA4A